MTRTKFSHYTDDELIRSAPGYVSIVAQFDQTTADLIEELTKRLVDAHELYAEDITHG